MRVGISVSPTKSRFGPVLYAEDFEALCALLAGLGYSGIELSLVSASALTPGREQSIGRHGLKVFSIATGQSYLQEGICLYSVSESNRTKAVERLKSFLPIAQAHGCAVIVGGIRGNEQVPEDLLAEVKAKGDQALGEVAESAGQPGGGLLLEPINRYESRFYNSVSSCANLIQNSALSNVKILVDTFHMNIEEPSLQDSLSAHSPLIGYIHVADSNRLFPGAGHLDFSSFFRAVRSCAFAGVIGLEVLPLPDSQAAASRSIREVQSYLKEV